MSNSNFFAHPVCQTALSLRNDKVDPTLRLLQGELHSHPDGNIQVNSPVNLPDSARDVPSQTWSCC